MTLGVVKNIIPAIASTNATIAAACSNECLKILSYCASPMDNYMLFVGKSRINCDVMSY
jgi:ubiquitin-activating enzyme E1 C